ncbi:chemotaxis protein CheA [Marinobacter sp. X15-166B]|uniref:chemotaxis protein CheA n=1 Tax=Marinobacter sp. X15-166B TaxID=1897620 RepID=UPI00085C3E56|nr:chemotaxis protein CheA [Marinobacter sp. X15-166B]OEY67089.1 chemotaxis protein CheA [Marinobacter sp. X15-166B]
MAFDADDEILQDFLVEAGEILEKLSEQLVELEQNPDDSELLNAIFRGFHTVKGGAGFLQLDALVDCLHSAENVFDILRNHKRRVDAELMDVVLETHDHIIAIFEQLRRQEALTPAPVELIAALDAFAIPASAEVADAATAGQPVVENPGNGDITDDEFERLLDALTEDAPAAPVSGQVPSDDSGTGGDDITDDEFEALLDQLHGEGQFKGAVATAGDTVGDDAITDDEFEALLDELHGAGQFKGAVSAEPGSAAADDAMSDAEFNSLLDELHGQGTGPTAAGPSSAPPEHASSQADAAPVTAAVASQKTAPARDTAPAAETTVRVDTRRLDDIMNMVGELVLVRNRLQRLGGESGDEHMQQAVSNLDVVTTDLQAAVMHTRMQPIRKVFGRFPRVVRDLARSLNKEVSLVMHGEDTDLDKNLVEALADPLVHLVRNAVDHGVEMPDAREQAGKPRVGTVTLTAEQEGDHILLTIADDGAGMDANKLRRLAVERGLYDQEAADRLTESDCFNLIFAAGFSTKTEVSDVSGRGVGMDVVKTKINQLNGILNVESKLGEGSRIVIKVPLTLAIMPTLMVMLGDQSFALPLVNVVEIFHLDLTKKNIVDGRECIVVRDKVFPLFHIKRWLVKGATGESSPVNGHVVIVALGTQHVGFVVDQLIGQEEVVIKPLGRGLMGTPGVAGATITGDGRVALIVDVASLLQHYG